MHYPLVSTPEILLEKEIPYLRQMLLVVESILVLQYPVKQVVTSSVDTEPRPTQSYRKKINEEN